MDKYNIIYSNTKGVSNPNPTSYTKDDLPLTLVNLSFDGFKFVGWLDENEKIITELDVTRLGDRYLYAVWQQLSNYTIRYDDNAGGDEVLEMPDDTNVIEGNDYVISNRVPKRKDYNFISWNTKSDGTGNILKPGDVIFNIEENQVYYAVWDQIPDPQITVIINYKENSNGDLVNNMPGNDTILKGSNYTISNKIPVREGYTFVEWNTNESGTGDTHKPNDTIENVRDAIVNYAQWKKDEIPPKPITIEFDGNGEGDTVTDVPAAIAINSGDTLIIPDEIPKRDGYKFLNWNSNQDGSGTSVNPGEKIENFENSEDFYAQWEIVPRMVTIDFDKNTTDVVSNMPATISVPSGSDIIIPSDIPKRDGYIFLNWNTDPKDLGNKIYPNQTLSNVTDDQKLFAIWYKIPVKIVRVCSECRCICCGCKYKINEVCNCQNNCNNCCN